MIDDDAFDYDGRLVTGDQFRSIFRVAGNQFVLEPVFDSSVTRFSLLLRSAELGTLAQTMS